MTGVRDDLFDAMLAAIPATHRTEDGAAFSLAPLRTRELDDPTIALLYAWAGAADVLTYYAGAFAQEGFLASAQERLSLAYLAATVGFRPPQFIAAETTLAVTVSPGGSGLLTIPARTAFRSTPAAGASPVTFETQSDAILSVDRNLFVSIALMGQTLGPRSCCAVLAGTGLGLGPGSPLLFASAEIDDWPRGGKAPAWQFVQATQVQEDKTLGVTEVSWGAPLIDHWKASPVGNTPWPLAGQTIGIRAFDKVARAFGWNAPDWKSAPAAARRLATPFGHFPGDFSDWPDFGFSWDAFDLDQVVSGPAPSQVYLGWEPGETRLGLIQAIGTETIDRWGTTRTVSHIESGPSSDRVFDRELTPPRQWASATSLPTSGRVLIVGGLDAEGRPLGRVSFWDEATALLDDGPELPAPRAGHSAHLLDDGVTVAVFGGTADGQAAVAGAYLLDTSQPAAKWAEADVRDGQPRAFHQATALPTGDVLLSGGLDASGAIRADVQMMTLSAGGPSVMPVASMISPRIGHSATPWLVEGRWTVALSGGYDGMRALSSVETFDPVAGAVSVLPGGLSTGRSEAASLGADTGLTVAGGMTGAGAVPISAGRPPLTEFAAPPAEQVRGAVEPLNTTLPLQLTGHQATRLDDGSVLITGGGSAGATATCWMVSRDLTTVRPVEDLPLPVSRHTATAVGGSVVIAGGIGADGKASDAVFAYVPPPDWADLGPVGVDAADATLTLLEDGTFLVAGLHRASLNTAVGLAAVFGPHGPVGSPFPLAVPRSAHGGALRDDGTVLLAGGLGADGRPVLELEVLDPTTRTATVIKTALSCPRISPAMVRLSGGGILIAGGQTEDASPTAELLLPDAENMTIWDLSLVDPRIAVTSLLQGVLLFVDGAGDIIVLDEQGAGGDLLSTGAKGWPAALGLPDGDGLIVQDRTLIRISVSSQGWKMTPASQPLPASFARPQMSLQPDGSALITDGAGTGRMLRFDPRSGAVTDLGPGPLLEAVPTIRVPFTGVAALDGEGHVRLRARPGASPCAVGTCSAWFSARVLVDVQIVAGAPGTTDLVGTIEAPGDDVSELLMTVQSPTGVIGRRLKVSSYVGLPQSDADNCLIVVAGDVQAMIRAAGGGACQFMELKPLVLAPSNPATWASTAFAIRRDLAPTCWSAQDLTDWPGFDPTQLQVLVPTGLAVASSVLLFEIAAADGPTSWTGPYTGLRVNGFEGLPFDLLRLDEIAPYRPEPAPPPPGPARAKLPDGRSGHAAAPLADGRVLIVGGRNADGALCSDSWVFDPKTGVLAPGPAMPGPLADLTLTPQAAGSLLLAGGIGPSGPSAELWSLRPDGGSPAAWAFRPLPPLPAARSGHAAQSGPGWTLIVGGSGAGGAPLDDWRLVPDDGEAVSGSTFCPRPAPTTCTIAVDGIAVVLIAGDEPPPFASAPGTVDAVSIHPPGGPEDVWSARSTSMTTRLPIARPGTRLAGRLDGMTVTFIGGEDTSAAPSAVMRYRLRRDVSTDARLARAGSAVATGPRQALALAGGRGASGVFQDAVALYVNDMTTAPRIAPSAAAFDPACAPMADGSWVVTGGRSAKDAPVGTVSRWPVCDEIFVDAGLLPKPEWAGRVAQLSTGAALVSFTNDAWLWDPASSALVQAAVFAHPIAGHTATPVLGGGVVLIAGGGDPANPTSSTCLYSATAKVLSPGPSMDRARAGHVAVALADGKVLIVGGDPGGILASELYFPRGPGFGALANGPPAALVDHTGTLLPDGRVLVCGGSTEPDTASSGFWIFDPQVGWSGGIGRMTDARRRHAATALPDGKVLVVGGDDGKTVLTTAELIDPDNWSSTPVSDMAQPRRWHATALMPDDRVVVAGGDDGDGDVLQAEIYDPRTTTFQSSDLSAHGHSGSASGWLPGRGLLLVGGQGGVAQAELFQISPLRIDGSRRSVQVAVGERKLALAETPDPHPFLPPHASLRLSGTIALKVGEEVMIKGLPPYAVMERDLFGRDAYGGRTQVSAGDYVIVLEWRPDARGVVPRSVDALLGLRGGGVLSTTCLEGALTFLADVETNDPTVGAICSPTPTAPAGLTTSLPRPVQAEMTTVTGVQAAADFSETTLDLGGLAHVYSRASLSVFGNVLRVVQGRSVIDEVLGGGDRLPAAGVLLRQGPLASVMQDTETQAQIDVFVDGILWRRQDRLDGAGPRDQVYRLDADASGRGRVVFGNGRNGAAPGPGVDNITATYRVGGGEQGNLPAGSLQRPPDGVAGVKAVSQFMPAAGGLGAPGGEVRRAIPTSTKSLDRVVSLGDVADFCRDFPGIADVRVDLVSEDLLAATALRSASRSAAALAATAAEDLGPTLFDEPGFSTPLDVAAISFEADAQALLASPTSTSEATLATKTATSRKLLMQWMKASLDASPSDHAGATNVFAATSATLAALLAGARPVLATVAGPGGAFASQDTLGLLNRALVIQGHGSGATITADNYRPRYFNVALAVQADADLSAAQVMAAVEARIRSRWKFDFGAIGAPVRSSDVLGEALKVTGVRAAMVKALYLNGELAALNDVLIPAKDEEGPLFAALIVHDVTLSSMTGAVS